MHRPSFNFFFFNLCWIFSVYNQPRKGRGHAGFSPKFIHKLTGARLNEIQNKSSHRQLQESFSAEIQLQKKEERSCSKSHSSQVQSMERRKRERRRKPHGSKREKEKPRGWEKTTNTSHTKTQIQQQKIIPHFTIDIPSNNLQVNLDPKGAGDGQLFSVPLFCCRQLEAIYFTCYPDMNFIDRNNGGFMLKVKSCGHRHYDEFNLPTGVAVGERSNHDLVIQSRDLPFSPPSFLFLFSFFLIY